MTISVIIVLKVIFLEWVFVTCTSQLAIPDQLHISHILNQFGKYLQNKPIQRTSDKSEAPPSVTAAIDDKIKELKEYLEDNSSAIMRVEKSDDDDEETTIIEFIPSLKSPRAGIKQRSNDDEPFANHKYQKMRDIIKVAFEKERVSNKTKKMVIKTIDEMIANVAPKQCEWNTKQKQILRTQESGACYFNNTKLSKECKSIVKQYLSDMNSNITQNNKNLLNLKEDIHNRAVELEDFFRDLWQNVSLDFLNKFTQTVSDVMKETQTLSEKYKVKCSLIKIGSEKDAATRRSACDDFKICTEELREYLVDFYNHLNETAVSAFSNYAEMYVKDVNSGASDEKGDVIKTIRDLSEIVERRVIDAFIKRVAKIKLNEIKNKQANIKVMKDFVKGTVHYIRKYIQNNLNSDLNKLGATLLYVIKQDIKMNLNVDLINVESVFSGKVCTFFVTCNRETAGVQRARDDSLDPYGVFVKVDLNLDDDLKEIEPKIKQMSKQIISRSNKEKNENPHHTYSARKTDSFKVTRTRMTRSD